MSASERLLRFAADCEVMAKFTSSPENKIAWRRMAERWIQCAELYARQETLAHAVSQRRDIGSPKIIGFIRTASQLQKFFQVLTIK